MSRQLTLVAVSLALTIVLLAVAGAPEAVAAEARIWDAMKKYDYKFYAFEKAAWPDRAQWQQVAHGDLEYEFVGDAIIENGNFWLFLKSSPYDSPFLYANINGRPGFCSELYTRSRDWVYNHRPVHVKILKNTPDEVLVEYEGDHGPHHEHKLGKTVIVRYRVCKNTGWIEVEPVGGAGGCQPYQQSHHSSPNRFAVAPSNTEDGNDLVVDPYKVPEGKIVEYPLPPENNRFILQQIYWGYHDHCMYMLTYPDAETARPTIWGNNYQEIPRLETINALFGAKKVILGVINHRDVFHHEDVGKPITAGGKYVSSWEAPYPGVWRMTGRVTDGKSEYYPESGTPDEAAPHVVRAAHMDGRHYTNTVVVTQGAENPFVFTSPVEGMLEYVIIYLYDRTEETPGNISTPMDIYRETIRPGDSN